MYKWRAKRGSVAFLHHVLHRIDSLAVFVMTDLVTAAVRHVQLAVFPSQKIGTAIGIWAEVKVDDAT
eukprot:COSAG06_NODE_26450_length_614_cov_1.392233_2_plen_67_part_00